SVLTSAMVCEFATVSAAGLPIDTPLLCQVDPGSPKVSVTTGMAYPAKAERARRRPRVGLTVEVSAGPVIAMAALAGVLDRDVDANAARYARLCAPILPSIGGGRRWEVLREAPWYWSRIFIECLPVSIY